MSDPNPPQPPPAPPGGSSNRLLIIGGAVAAFVFAVVLVVVLLKVIGGGSPEAVAEDYLDAQWNSEFEDYCEMQADDYRAETVAAAEADDCREFGKKSKGEYDERSEEIEKQYDQNLDEVRDDFDRELQITDVEEDGDKASVEFTETIEYTGDNDEFANAKLGDTREEKNDGTVDLLKEDGDWKVAVPAGTPTE